MRSICALASLVLATAAMGQKKATKERSWADDRSPPSFILLPSTSEKSALSMQCTGAAPYVEIQCTFDQLSIVSPDPEKLAQKLAAWPEETLKELGEKSWPKERAKLCATIEKADRQPPARSAEAQAAFLQDFATFKALCACDSAKCAVEAMRPMVERQERACRITHNRFEFSFKRVSLDRWVHTSTQGLCNNTFLATLDRKESLLWTFTQRRIPGDTKGDGLCSKEESTSVFTWENAGNEFDLSKSCAGGRFKFSVF